MIFVSSFMWLSTSFCGDVEEMKLWHVISDVIVDGLPVSVMV